MHPLFFFLSLLLLIPFTSSITHPSHKSFLSSLKSAIDPSSIPQGSCISSWDFSSDPCDSLFSSSFTCGFRCDSVDGNKLKLVTEISLDSAGYAGTVPSSFLYQLSSLSAFEIPGNGFRGPIPGSLFSLPKLRRVSLSRNQFSGAIPAGIGNAAALEELYLDNNQVSGEVPNTIARVKSLRRLEIQGNRITGGFPDLGILQNLEFLDASDNAISGVFPANLPLSLLEVSFRNNGLEGDIPATIVNLRYLQVLDCGRNRLSGAVPAAIFEHPSLQQVALPFNRFSGIEIPMSFGMTSELIALDLTGNRISGFLPVFLTMMPRLSALLLEHNLLTGMIPMEYAIRVLMVPGEMGVEPFARLLLAGNYLFGPIPAGLVGLKPGSVTVSLADNCLFRCPRVFFFCQGGSQKSTSACRGFNPGIPAGK